MIEFTIADIAEAQRRVLADREEQAKKLDVVGIFAPFCLDLSTPGHRPRKR